MRLEPGPYVVVSYWKNFSSLNLSILGIDLPTTRSEGGDAGLAVFSSTRGLMLMRFIAFAYTYHYLNWFSKTSIIKWHEVGAGRLAAIAALWAGSVALYLYDYARGVQWLLCLSYLHVYLEFPLNHISILGTFRELRGRLAPDAPLSAAARSRCSSPRYPQDSMTPFRWNALTTVESAPGILARLGTHAHALGFTNTLLVADRGMIDAGFVDRARASLEASGIAVSCFHGFGENPDSAMCEAGAAAAQGAGSIVALGGGSSLDCAKGINFLATNGGRIHHYHGYGKASRPMLPMIGIPTTTGTGSEAQSYALLSDAETHVKMACGSPGAAFRLVLLDPELVLTQPRAVLAASGYDAISHAVETFVTSKRNAISDCFAREAWRLLESAFEPMLAGSRSLEHAAAMQTGAYLAGAAIECSMLGAAHACANPLTARYGTVHGVAIALLLAHVVRWNRAVAAARYDGLHAKLDSRLDELAAAAGLPRRLRDIDVPEGDITILAASASKQWTGTFNPRPFDEAAAVELYRCAY
jgi:alcohol dehydrogenase